MKKNNRVIVFDTTKRNWGSIERFSPTCNQSHLLFPEFVKWLSTEKGVILIFAHLSDITNSVDELCKNELFLNAIAHMSKLVSVVLYSGDAVKLSQLQKVITGETNFVLYPINVSHTADALREFAPIIDEWTTGESSIKDLVENKLKDVVAAEALNAFRLLLHLAVLKKLPVSSLINAPSLLKVKNALDIDRIFWAEIWKPFPVEVMKNIIDRFDNDSRFDNSGEKGDLIDCMSEVWSAQRDNVVNFELEGYCLDYFEQHLRKEWGLVQ